MAAWALGGAGLLYAFATVIDPWGSLPADLPLPRVPISSNARFSFPALARNRGFDSAVFGTSTSRLLQPATLNPAFAGHFVNLAMNSATAWEQTQLLAVFLRAHPQAKTILIDMDWSWCGPTADRLTPRPFPAWMYAENRWPGYREMLTPYAIQEAANQLAVMAGWKRRRYGIDGYTRFTPADTDYDPARVDAAFARWAATDAAPARPGDAIPLPALALLPDAVRSMPPQTRKILFFPPISVEQQGAPGTREAARWAACKREATAIATRLGAQVLDMLIPSAITTTRASYWDPLHFRESVAAHTAQRLASPEGPDIQVLAHPDPPRVSR